MVVVGIVRGKYLDMFTFLVDLPEIQEVWLQFGFQTQREMGRMGFGVREILSESWLYHPLAACPQASHLPSLDRDDSAIN